jgi:hypothetical protein
MDSLQKIEGDGSENVGRLAFTQARAQRARKSLEAERERSQFLSAQNFELRVKLGEDVSGEFVGKAKHDFGPANRKVAERALEEPSECLSWHSFSTVRDTFGNEAEQGLWDRVWDEQAIDLATGQHAAMVVQENPSPADRTRFMVIRNNLADEWKPRPGSETMMVDMMAQAWQMYETWLQRHVYQITYQCGHLTPGDKERAQYKEWFPPRLSESEAIELSVTMATRFQNQFLRLVRALRDLRRMMPSLVIQNAGQVNVGQQQVNVAGHRAEL